MIREDLLNIILNYFKQKDMLSDLEKDIISTIEKYFEEPFDRKGAEQRILENNQHHPDVFITISAYPGIQTKPFTESSDEEVHYNLYQQLEAMWAKNIQGQNTRI